MRRCAQCWKPKPIPDFIGARGRPITWCKACRLLYRSGGRRESRRAGLDAGTEHRFSFVRSSKNQKLGPIAATMTSGETCPEACELKDAGCYGEFGLLKMHWAEVSQHGLSFGPFLDLVASLPEGALWRHNVVGDLMGRGNRLDVDALRLLTMANEGRRGFTYTHKPCFDGADWMALYEATRAGFTVNLSCNGLDHLDQMTALGLAGAPLGLPAVVVLPKGTAGSVVSPRGVRVIVCPAETRENVTCATCGICARADRKFAIGFPAHGQWAEKVTQLVDLRVKGKANAKSGAPEGRRLGQV